MESVFGGRMSCLVFVHPDDQELVDRLVPGNRVFKKEECPNFADRKLGYSQLSYGDQVFRSIAGDLVPPGV